jgi:hypothetical protein
MISHTSVKLVLMCLSHQENEKGSSISLSSGRPNAPATVALALILAVPQLPTGWSHGCQERPVEVATDCNKCR